jgi:hypothetical protein
MLVSNDLRSKTLDSPFFIVATPGNLHIIKLCLKFVPANQDCVVVLNGLERWERAWAQNHFKAKGFITFPFLMAHEQVIDYLLDWMKKPFGLIDYDCFVFTRDYFEKIKQFPKKAVISSYYGFKSSTPGTVFPETFFLFINTPVIQRIKKKFGINSSIIPWERLPLAAQIKLKEIGITRENLPESHKTYFDTLRVIMALCVAEDYEFHFPGDTSTNQTEAIFHVGSVATVPFRGASMKSRHEARGSYFWYKALETTADREIQERYYAKYGYLRALDVLEKLPNAREIIGENFFSTVERVINS